MPLKPRPLTSHTALAMDVVNLEMLLLIDSHPKISNSWAKVKVEVSG